MVKRPGVWRRMFRGISGKAEFVGSEMSVMRFDGFFFGGEGG